MTEFKPGDVVLRPKYGRGLVAECGWVYFAGPYVARLSEVADARRLVVIDPEGREEVERLRDLMDAAHAEQNDYALTKSAPSAGARGNALQAALREFANPKPPKPKEPTGLGAVVEDAEGDKWVWTAQGADGSHWLRVGYPRLWATWENVPAVRVLSEGVQP